MKTGFRNITLMMVVALLMGACQSSLVEPVISLQSSSNFTDSSLSYGKPVVYLSNGGSNLLTPASIPVIGGTFSAVPKGLVIDSLTGVVNMTNSETGMWFTVKYTHNGQTWQTPLMISGIDYRNKFAMPGTTTYLTPVYNADTTKTLPSATFSVPGNSNVVIDPLTGAVNVNQSIANAGLTLGQMMEFTIHYTLSDSSNQAPNKIKMQLYRYYSMNDVPQWLKNKINGTSDSEQLMTGGSKTQRPPVSSTIEEPNGEADRNKSIKQATIF